MKTKELFQNIALVAASIIFAAVLMIVGEVVVRHTSNITFLGNSANLWIPNAVGTSRGNAKNSVATSFGVDVHTDEYGFRVGAPSNRRHQELGTGVFIFGDSVGFGAGVEYLDTFAGRLETGYPPARVFNSSVIGYSVDDYKNVADYVFPKFEDQTDAAFLIFCLNDVSKVSATRIDAATTNQDPTPAEETGYGLISRLKQSALLNSVNSYLRSRSKLYLLLKGLVTDPQQRYWQAELENYQQQDESDVAQILRPIVVIADDFKSREVPFVVVVIPFEYQLRNNSKSMLLPQELLGSFFRDNNITYIDAIEIFRERSDNPSDLYLPFDPMHLSADGHELLYEIILAQIYVTDTPRPQEVD